VISEQSVARDAFSGAGDAPTWRPPVPLVWAGAEPGSGHYCLSLTTRRSHDWGARGWNAAFTLLGASAERIVTRTGVPPSQRTVSSLHCRTMRVVLLALCRLLLRIFFRRIEVVGKENLPSRGPVVFILNHPNGLLDPLFILCMAGRPVSLLAKEPLFRTFFVSYFVKAFECLPVYRKSDGADPAKNRAVVERAIALLRAGNAIALFPEGTSHSDPMLKPLKPGAARMALSASSASLGEDVEPVHVVPIGLYYSRKSRFRSRALINFGVPLLTPRVALDDQFNPPRDAVAALTERLAQALNGVTLNADSTEALLLAQRAERILRAAEEDDVLLSRGTAVPPKSPSLWERKQLRQRLVDGYASLRDVHSESVGALVHRIDSYETRVADVGLRPEQRVLFRAGEVVLASIAAFVTVIVLLPAAIVGFVMNAATYLIVDWLAFTVAKGEEDIVATVKAAGGLLLFAVTWLLFAVVGWLVGSVGIGLGLLVAGPTCAYCALVLRERFSHVFTQSYAVWLLLLRPRLRRWVVDERRGIREDVLTLESLLEPQAE